MWSLENHLFYSLNSSLPNAKHCTLKNGTTVYYNKPKIDCTCLAATHTDSDFGGAAVISSFLAMGWLTIFVAAVPTIWSMARTWERIEGPKRFWKWLWEIIQFEPNHVERKTGVLNYPPRFSTVPRAQRTASYSGDSANSVMTDGDRDSRQPLPASRPYHNLERSEPTFCTFARRITFQLCDIQIITGIAILVAAIAQERHITFYHAQIAQQYWWMTLNSFWISRIDYSRNSPEMLTWRAHARRSAIWSSVALSIVIQVLVTIRENTEWDPLLPGQCYKTDATGSSYAQNLFWLCGTILYFIVITMSLFTITRGWFDRYINDKVEPSLRKMNTLVLNSLQDFREYRQGTKGVSEGFMHSLMRVMILSVLAIKLAARTVAWLAWWIFILFVSIWCAGNSAAPLELLIYGGIAAFLTWWILFLKIQNLPLMVGRQEEWTYGATLNLFIYVLIAFHFLDVWAGVKRDEHLARRKHEDEEAMPTVQRSDTSRTNDFALANKEVNDVSQRSGRGSSDDEHLPAVEPTQQDDLTSKEKT